MNREEEIVSAGGGVMVELLLGDAASSFDLEKAVCSHGLFMMAPNHWDSHSKTLRRPLRLNLDDNDETSVTVHVSHPPHSQHALIVRVFGPNALSLQQQQSLQSQVRRMLRLSEEENRRVIEFHKMHEQAERSGFGRVFRSPTLFEDMVKCILLCNCQWPRTLSMAQSLCELQAELSISQADNTKHFAPKTPSGKESKRKPRKYSQKSANKCTKVLGDEETEVKVNITTALISESCDHVKTEHIIPKLASPEATSSDDPNISSSTIGNFPSPTELATLDENFLAKRCGLGYRAGRVIKLAKGVVEGKIQLRELECDSGTLNLSDYDKLAEKLRGIDGFGPFTCANVLMCMGYYHVIPTDSETIRHLKQVHARITSIKTVQRDVEDIYEKYAPFQFLAFWSEIWRFYEERFGKLSEIPHSCYKLITAANMREKTEKGSKRAKSSLHDVSGDLTGSGKET